MTGRAKSHIVKQGEAWTIRIPRRLLERAGLGEEVVLEVRPGQIVVRSPQGLRRSRQAWEEQFAAMAERGDDQLLDPDVPSLTTWDTGKWEW
jgi:antitoxin component of MazEF toxin-antitoxin module